jgi:ABC-type branched-subunit amino acid transport system ATPase component
VPRTSALSDTRRQTLRLAHASGTGAEWRRLRRLHANGLAILLVEQDVAQSLEVADRAHVLKNRIFAIGGPAASVRDDPNLKRAYLGL